MPFFPYNEPRYYFFGLKAAFKNVFANGLRLGVKKTLGKITQPINAYSRFPEYYYFDDAISAHLQSIADGREIRILDVGSPKTLGLYLAATTRAEVTMTDISELNVDEYRVMWQGLEKKARGSAVFAMQDARALQYGNGEFDVVYSMSVIEHIEGASGDSEAIREMIRVLKPGGLLVISVPFGTPYIEQQRVGFAGAVRETRDSQAYFFQRIYDQPVFEKRILGPATQLEQIVLTTVWRRNRWIARSFGALGTNLKGLLGFMNPVLSVAVNRSDSGIVPSFPVNYGSFHTGRDVYGDMIMAGRKAGR